MTTRAVESRSQRLVRLQALSEWSRCRRGVEWSLAKGFKRRLSEPSCERRYCFSSERSPSLRPTSPPMSRQTRTNCFSSERSPSLRLVPSGGDGKLFRDCFSSERSPSLRPKLPPPGTRCPGDCFSSERSPSLRRIQNHGNIAKLGQVLLLFREKPFVEARRRPARCC